MKKFVQRNFYELVGTQKYENKNLLGAFDFFILHFDLIWMNRVNDTAFAACKLQLDGWPYEKVNTSLKLTNPDEDVNITVWGSPNSCTLRILAVGGGGGE